MATKHHLLMLSLLEGNIDAANDSVYVVFLVFVLFFSRVCVFPFLFVIDNKQTQLKLYI